MAPRNHPFSPIKVLLLIFVGSIAALALLVGAGAFWFFSVRNQPRAEDQRATFPWEGADRNQRSFSLADFEVVSSQGTVPRRPPPAASNAILAAHGTNDQPLPGDDIFKDLVIPRLKITIPRQGMAALSRDQNSREYVQCTIEEGDMVYTNVAIRLKGGPGSRRPIHDHPAFTVNFDNFAPGQKFHGLKKIHLNNSVQDSSYLEEKISRELFEAAGVPVPRAGNAHVTVNGQEWGIYVLVEGVNKPFLRRYFSDATGNVYDGKSGMDITTSSPPMQVNSGDDRTDHTGLKALRAAVREPVADGARLAALERTLDVERFLSYMAMEMILWHWDGYTMARNNWRIFHDRQANRMVFIPQGVDQMFQQPNGPLFPQQQNGLVARAVLQVPELRERYVQRLAYITTNVFLPEAISARISEVSERIAEVIGETDSPNAATSHLGRANGLRRKVRQRASFLESQIFPAAVADFETSSVIALEDWEPRIDIPEAKLTREEDENGNYLLHISTETGCTASWRTTRMLDRGRYRMEARIRTKGVVLDPADRRAGAGLRISRHREGQRNDGDRDWMDISFEFEVAEPQRSIEMVCELRANQGEIWYDLKSLKLRRL